MSRRWIRIFSGLVGLVSLFFFVSIYSKNGTVYADNEERFFPNPMLHLNLFNPTQVVKMFQKKNTWKLNMNFWKLKSS